MNRSNTQTAEVFSLSKPAILASVYLARSGGRAVLHVLQGDLEDVPYHRSEESDLAASNDLEKADWLNSTWVPRPR